MSTKALKSHYGEKWRNAYKEIKNFLQENGFKHRQWSGYVSENKMNTLEIAELNGKMWMKFPWLEQCAKKMDVTDVGRTSVYEFIYQFFFRNYYCDKGWG